MENTEQIERVDVRIALFQSQVKEEAKSNRPISASHTQTTVDALIDVKEQLEKEKVEAKSVRGKRKKANGKTVRTKYDYPEGMSSDDKRKFRSKARREAAKS